MNATIAMALVLASTLALDLRDEGKIVHAPPETTIVVRLDAQLGTGYGWQVAELGDTLIQIGDPEVEDSDGRAGRSERQVFRFRVRGEGRSTLRMVYVRPWEKDADPAKTFSVVIDSE